MPAIDFNLLKSLVSGPGNANGLSVKSRDMSVPVIAPQQKISPKDNTIRRRSFGTNRGFDFGSFASKGLSLLSGASDLASNVMNASQIGDTSLYDSQINSLNSLGYSPYSSYEQALGDYSQLGSFDVESSDIRGMNLGQKIGSVGSAALTGATAGSAFGPWGTLIGGVVGAGAGLGGVLLGDINAEREAARLSNESYLADNDARRRLEDRTENLTQYNFNSGIANMAERGGKIKKQQSLDEFAARVLKRPRVRYSNNTGVIRQRCNGGIMIRVKR